MDSEQITKSITQIEGFNGGNFNNAVLGALQAIRQLIEDDSDLITVEEFFNEVIMEK